MGYIVDERAPKWAACVRSTHEKLMNLVNSLDKALQADEDDRWSDYCGEAKRIGVKTWWKGHKTQWATGRDH